MLRGQDFKSEKNLYCMEILTDIIPIPQKQIFLQ